MNNQPDTPDKTIPQMLREYNTLVAEANGLNRGLGRERKCFKDRADAVRSLAAIQSSIRAARAAARAPELTGQQPESEQDPVSHWRRDETPPKETKIDGQRALEAGDLPIKQGGPPVASKIKRTTKAKPKAAKPKVAANGHDGPRKGSKMEALHRMLTRKSGCTRAQVLAETGWPSVSMQAIAKGLKIKLRQEKEKGSVTTYFGE